jgi:hypothetical protein
LHLGHLAAESLAATHWHRLQARHSFEADSFW